MALHRSLLRHCARARASTSSLSYFARSLATRPDFLNTVTSKPRPSASSALLDSLRPEPERSSSAASTPPRRQSPQDVLSALADRLPGDRTGAASATDAFMTRAEGARRSKAIERMAARKWRTGDVYAPHDLSPEEMRKHQKYRPPGADVFDVLNINPLDEFKNLPLLMDFVTPLGRLKHQRETGLRPVNQRKISKAVRRATSLALLPRTHAHPEMLRRPGPWSRRNG